MASLLIKPYVWACIGLSYVFCANSGISSNVPDGVVYTDLHKSAEMGSRTVLKCQFYGTPIGVYWKKGEDPITASNLITWVEGEREFGSCVNDKSCEIDDDYSLIIKNLSIADQGRYICRISNYNGILIHNFTDLGVFALPKEPFPIINECTEEFDLQHVQCTISTSNPINITCTVQRYFPTVDLFFLHESRKYTPTKTLEVTNTDGTKNKSISAQAAPTNVLYVCVAYNIPGAQDQRTATISVTSEDDVTTRFDPASMMTTNLGEPITINVIKIVVPIALGIVVIACFVTLVVHLKHRTSENRNGNHSQEMLRMIPNVKPVEVPSKFKSPIDKKNIDKFVYKLTSRHCRRLAKTLKVNNEQIEEIILKNNFNMFDTRTMITDWVRDLKCSNYEKRCRLDDAVFKIGRYDIQDHFGTISFRLQKGILKADPLHPHSRDIDYESISDDDLDQLVKLAECIQPSKKYEIFKNMDIPFDNEGRWRASLREQLLKLRNEIVAKTSDGDPLKILMDRHQQLIKETDSEFPLTDNEINDVDKHVTSIHKRRELLRILGIDVYVQPDESLADLLRGWRDLQTSKDGRDRLEEALDEIGYAGCIMGRIATEYVCQAELARIAFDLLMGDVRPLIETLGIDQTIVTRYFKEVNDLENSTTALVFKLLKSGERKDTSEMDRQELFMALRNIGFVDVACSVYFGYEISLSELRNILNCIATEDMSRFLEHLGFSAADIENTDSFELMKLWKRRVQAVPRCYLLEIVTAMEAAGLHEVADKVLSGVLQSKKPNEDVVRDICSRLSDDILITLCCLWDLRASDNRDNQEKRILAVIKWMNDWMERFDQSNTDFRFGHAKDRRQKNNLLFRRGLFEFADEIRALENCQHQSDIKQPTTDRPIT